MTAKPPVTGAVQLTERLREFDTVLTVGAVGAAGTVLDVVALPEDDHGPSPPAFCARTCTRYPVFAVRPVRVAVLAVPTWSWPPDSPASIQSFASVGSAVPAKYRMS